MAIWNLTLDGDGLPWPHRVGYRPVPSGRVTPFEISFFDNGVGYLVDDAGDWYRADSVMTSPRLCANLSRPRLDLTVTLLHPTEVGRDERFTMNARDARDTSLAPDPALWIGFSCEVDSAHVAYMSAPPVGRRMEHQCSLPHRDPDRPYPVLLYVRDTRGAVGWCIDTIAVRPTP